MKKYFLFLLIFVLTLLFHNYFFNNKTIETSSIKRLKASKDSYISQSNKLNNLDIILLTKDKNKNKRQEPTDDLKFKEKFLETLNSQVYDKLLENNKEKFNKYETEIIQEKIENIFTTSSEGNWKNFNLTTDSLDEYSIEVLNISLIQALSNNAPIATIKDLLKKGANFQPNSISYLAIYNHVGLTKQLLPLGLDIHGVDTLGENGISSTLIRLSSREMFDFLIERNVSVKPSPYGFDPLDIALEHLLTKNNAIYYVQQLVANHAPIENSHRELVALIKDANPHAYIILKNTAPELFSAP